WGGRRVCSPAKSDRQLVLCLNLGKTYTFHCRRKSNGPRNGSAFLSMFRSRSAPEILTTFVTEPPSLLSMPVGELSATCQKSLPLHSNPHRIDFSFILSERFSFVHCEKHLDILRTEQKK